jgi:ABC-2 type transport system permease protein
VQPEAPSFFAILLRVSRLQTACRLRQVMAQSRLMVTVIVLFTIGYWVSFTWLFYRGMRFVQESVPALGDLLICRMFYLLFALVFVMLITSSVIVGYGVFFRNSETEWLQTLPVSRGRLFCWKSLEMSILASWAFLFLSGPVLIAYGMILRISPFFLLGVLVLYIPFSVLANSLGAMLTLLLARGWHSRWGRRAILAAAVLLLGVAITRFKPIDVKALRESELLPLMNLLLQNTRLAVEPMLPSYWLASAVIGLGEMLWRKMGFFTAVTTSYALLAVWVLGRWGGEWFHQAVSAVQDRAVRRTAGGSRMGTVLLHGSGHLLLGAMPWLARPVRAVLLKDWFFFWRDTVQWSQFAIFFGLLGFYFANIRNLHFQLEERFWVSVVAFLNLTSLGLILATLTTRFVFPQFSLEGQRFWLVGLSPSSLNQIVLGKFWASAFGCGGITLGLMSFSFVSLHLDASLRWLIGFCVVMMSLGLSGIAVGTGVLFPNLKQHNAAQIVSGFGGTFCLILSLGYVAVTVTTVAVPSHLLYTRGTPLDFGFASAAGLIYTWIFVVSLGAAWLPMRLAQKRLARFEM